MNEMKKIRILMISSYMIVPPTSGGAQRMVRPMIRFKQDDKIETDMLYTAYGDNIKKSKEYLEKYPCIDQALGIQPEIDLSDERAMPEGFCSDVWNTIGMEIKNTAVRMVQKKFYDIIQIEHSMMAWIVPYMKQESPESKFVLDLHNAEYRVYEKWLPYAAVDEYNEIYQKYERLYAWETMCWKWFDAAFTVSPIEAKLFHKVTGCKHVYEVPTGGGIELKEYEPEDGKRVKPYDLLYLGTMEWYPNAHGLLWFIKKVFPKVIAKRPETKLHIVGFGEAHGKMVEAAKEHPNIMFWGQQEDDKWFFHGAKVFVVPLFIGAGARVKIPTAWASRVPVASTVFAPEGLEAVDGENICMADEPDQYAENILRLLEDHEFCEKIVDCAFETLKRKYTCDVCVEKLKEAYREIVFQNTNEQRNKIKSNNLLDYHLDFIRNLTSKYDLKNKVILEIGCGKGEMLKHIASNYKPKYMVDIDPMISDVYKAEEGSHWKICKGDALKLEFPDQSFDIVISVAAFEHISDLDRCLSEIKRVLKPGGIFYTEYGPIWSCIIGHHCRNWIKEEVLKIPPWAHLYMSEQELYQYVKEHYSEEDAGYICKMVFHYDGVNRIDIKEMKESFQKSGMEIVELTENKLVNRLGWIDGSSESELTEEILELLKPRYTQNELCVCSLNLLLHKKDE